MKTTAVRMYGKEDLRLESFDLPEIGDDEILAKIVSDSLCMSSYKAAKQGSGHKRVPDNIADHPVILGHEMCGELVKIGSKWASDFREGQKFSMQPALNYKGSLDAPGYSYEYCGGDATYIIIPNEVMEMGCLLPYEGDAFFLGSLAEPVSCVAGGSHANFHVKQGTYVHEMGIKEGGRTLIVGGGGPMGFAFIDYILHCDRRPGHFVVVDIDQVKLDRAASIYSPEESAKDGITVKYVNGKSFDDLEQGLRDQVPGGEYDDIFVFAPVRFMVELSDKLLGLDGCLNFFAGPTDTNFEATINFYDVHYAFHHFVATSGGNTDDMKEALDLMGSGRINPAAMITHVAGLNAVPETTLSLPEIPGGKKLIYTHVNMPLVALEELEARKGEHALFGPLAEIVARHNGLWSVEAEQYLLANGEPITA